LSAYLLSVRQSFIAAIVQVSAILLQTQQAASLFLRLFRIAIPRMSSSFLPLLSYRDTFVVVSGAKENNGDFGFFV
jgi:hypothetical protein